MWRARGDLNPRSPASQASVLIRTRRRAPASSKLRNYDINPKSNKIVAYSESRYPEKVLLTSDGHQSLVASSTSNNLAETEAPSPW
jgi:hypothetical protein